MIKTIAYFRPSNSDSSETADLGEVPRSADCLHQAPTTLEGRVGTVAYSALLSPEPPHEDEADMNLTIEETLDQTYFKLPSFLEESDPLPFPLSPCPTTSNPELTSEETEPQIQRTISDKEWDLIKPLFEEEVENKKASPRSALNSILLMAIKGVPGKLLSSKGRNFSKRDAARDYFCLWQDKGNFEKSLQLLAKQAKGSSRSYYQSLLENFQRASSKGKPISIRMLNLSKSKRVKSAFLGVNNKEWNLVKHLLVKKIKRRRFSARASFNSILSILIDGTYITTLKTSKDFSSRTSVERNFNVWRKKRILEQALDRLIKEAQGSLQSDYRNLLKKLQDNPYSKTGYLSTSKLKLKGLFTRKI